MDQAVDVCNRLAAEHLEIHCQRPEEITKRIRHAGALFIGRQSAEVFGDYGLGPNHTLPTGSTARFAAGLSVFNFLRIRTWLKLESELPEPELSDIARLAELEGLHAHHRASLIDRTM